MPTQDLRLTLGDPRVINVKKCASGNCIKVDGIETPLQTRITDITKTGSDFVHPCDQTDNCGSKIAFIVDPDFPYRATWFGWTDSGDPSQVFVLHIEYVAAAQKHHEAAAGESKK
jgi:hypothetical protein